MAIRKSELKVGKTYVFSGQKIIYKGIESQYVSSTGRFKKYYVFTEGKQKIRLQTLLYISNK